MLPQFFASETRLLNYKAKKYINLRDIASDGDTKVKRWLI